MLFSEKKHICFQKNQHFERFKKSSFFVAFNGKFANVLQVSEKREQTLTQWAKWVRKMVELSERFSSHIIYVAENISSKKTNKNRNNWSFNLEVQGDKI